MLFDLVKDNRALIIARTSYGVFDGLLLSLAQIDRGGGALLRGTSMLEYGGNIIDAAIIPASTYIAWPGVKALPRPYWDFLGILPEIDPRSVTTYRARIPLAIVPLPAAVLPLLPLR